MNPASLIPAMEPVLIPWAWFDILLIVTFTAHVLFMNAVLGSAFIGLVHALRGDNGVAKEVGQKLPPLIAFTINLGVPPLLFLQVNYGHFDYVSSVLMGGWWLAVIAALLIAYYGFYTFKFKYGSMSSGARNTLFLVSLACLVYTGFMFTHNTTLMLRPDLWVEYFSTSGGFLNWHDATIYPRFLHFMTGAVAVGGLFIALLGQWKKMDALVSRGMTWFIRATMVNMAVGVWFLAALPKATLLGFMGDSLPATITLVAAVAAGVFMLLSGFKQEPRRTAILAVATVFLMVCTRHWVRTLELSPWFRMEELPVTHRYSSFYLFLGFVVVGGAICAYMVKLYLKTRGGRA